MKKSLILITFCISLAACVKKGPYEAMLEKELSRNVRNDSLFLGFHFNMPRKAFYASCWDMNKQGLLIQGPSNLSVEYDLDDEIDHPAYMRFYPQFDDEGNIYSMPMEFVYKAYSPTDPEMSSDSLLLEVKGLMERWYGNGFINLADSEGARRVYVKVDGNRRIRIFKRDVAYVAVDIIDMTSEEMRSDEEN